ncbi:MAG: hypothetical protein K8T25_10370 [Planctomycetia bacterium]|nr:hypothetical protein [Planctomycetia bacterium]
MSQFDNAKKTDRPGESLNPYAAPQIVAGVVEPEIAPEWEQFYKRHQRRWLNIRSTAMSCVYGGPLLIALYAYRAWDLWQRQRTVSPLATGVMIFWLICFVEGIGVLQLRPWARWLGVGTWTICLLWQLAMTTFRFVMVGRFFIMVDVISLVILGTSVVGLYSLLTPPAAKIFTPEFGEALRMMRLSGKRMETKPRTNYLVLLLLVVGIIVIFAVFLSTH